MGKLVKRGKESLIEETGFFNDSGEWCPNYNFWKKESIWLHHPGVIESEVMCLLSNIDPNIHFIQSVRC